MRVRAYTNLRLSALHEGYREGYPLELSYEADRQDLEGAVPEDAAEAIFGGLNSDHRPNPAFPSLSVGHVASYRTGAGEEGALAVEPMGWRRVPPPADPTDEERGVYRPKSETRYLPRGGVVIHDAAVDVVPVRLWEDDDGSDGGRNP